MSDSIELNRLFDDLLNQIVKGNSHENIEKGKLIFELELIKEWKSKNGFRFNIYSGDHFIDNKPHFHFDHREKGINCKIGFDGEIFESKGGDISKKIKKELNYFLSKPETQKILIEKWNIMNPDLKYL